LAASCQLLVAGGRGDRRRCRDRRRQRGHRCGLGGCRARSGLLLVLYGPEPPAGFLGRLPVEGSRQLRTPVMVNLREVAKLASARPVSSPYRDMTWISGGTFHMGSNKHYPEEAPARISLCRLRLTHVRTLDLSNTSTRGPAFSAVFHQPQVSRRRVLIEAWNARMRGTTSLRKREPLNTPK
jgi:hypothetical protein